MVEKPRGGRAAEARTEFFEECPAQRFEPRVLHRGDFGFDELVILLLPGAQIGRAGEKFVFRITGQRRETPALGFEAELRMHGELALELEAGTGGQFPRGGVLAVVRPDPQGETVARVDQLHFEEWLAVLRRFLRDRIDQHREHGAGAASAGGGAKGRDVGQVVHGKIRLWPVLPKQRAGRWSVRPAIRHR